MNSQFGHDSQGQLLGVAGPREVQPGLLHKPLVGPAWFRGSAVLRETVQNPPPPSPTC